MLKINEIFYSIQGESTYVGCPTVFIRLTGCNLRCTYCDTKYSYYEGEWINLSEIISQVKLHNTKYICITGGEPLLQKGIYQLMACLCDEEFKVSLETSGSKDCSHVDSRVKIILDLKTPSSGEVDKNYYENLNFIPPGSEIKFVIGTKEDFDWSENICSQYSLFEKYTVLYSPSHNLAHPKWLAEQILQKKSSARLQLQQHKYIWTPETRGV